MVMLKSYAESVRTEPCLKAKRPQSPADTQLGGGLSVTTSSGDGILSS